MNQVGKLLIGCDLFLDLKMYHIPDYFIKLMKNKYENVDLVEINTVNSESIDYSTIDIYWGNRITKNLIDELTSLKWIHFGSVGVNAKIKNKVINRNIRVSNSSGIMTDAVVSSGLAFIFAFARGLHNVWNLKDSNKFNRKSYDQFFENTHDVFGQSILIVGFGDIGKKLALACNSLGMKVSIIRKNYDNKPKWVKASYPIKELNEAVEDIDYIVNILPLNDQTKGVFTKNIFTKMKDESIFINIGRGDTVIESDLIDSLKNNIIGGAGLDVFSSESYVDPSTPLMPDSPLFSLRNVILTPHIGGLTNSYWKKQCNLFLDNLKQFISGKELINEIFTNNIVSD